MYSFTACCLDASRIARAKWKFVDANGDDISSDMKMSEDCSACVYWDATIPNNAVKMKITVDCMNSCVSGGVIDCFEEVAYPCA